MKIVVSRRELLAALLFASTDETRYVLNGVLLEWHPEKDRPVIVTTDGRRLAVIESEAHQEDVCEDAHSMLLRADFVKPICSLSRAFGGKNFPWIVFENKPGSKRVGVRFVESGSRCVLEVEENGLIEGAYPDWRKVLPKRGKGEAINELGLNSDYVGDFARAAKFMEASSPLIQMNLVGKEGAVEVRIPAVPNFYGLVMQCKLNEDTEYQPEFLHIVKDFPSEKPKEDEGTTVTISTNGELGVKLSAKDFAKAAQRLRTASEETPEGGEDEGLIEECVEVIRSEQKASVSLLQRRLRLGYSRASKIMDELESRGLVGPSKGAEPRDILMDLGTAKAGS